MNLDLDLIAIFQQYGAYGLLLAAAYLILKNLKWTADSQVAVRPPGFFGGLLATLSAAKASRWELFAMLALQQAKSTGLLEKATSWIREQLGGVKKPPESPSIPPAAPAPAPEPAKTETK
jgi:hypothetical protein